MAIGISLLIDEHIVFKKRSSCFAHTRDLQSLTTLGYNNVAENWGWWLEELNALASGWDFGLKFVGVIAV